MKAILCNLSVINGKCNLKNSSEHELLQLWKHQQLKLPDEQSKENDTDGNLVDKELKS